MATIRAVSSSPRRGSTNSPQLMETTTPTTTTIKESTTTNIALEEILNGNGTVIAVVRDVDSKSTSSKKSALSSGSKKSISSVVRWSIGGSKKSQLVAKLNSMLDNNNNVKESGGLTVDTRDETLNNINTRGRGEENDGNGESNGREIMDEVRDENCPFTPTQVVSSNIITTSNGGHSEKVIDIIDCDLKADQENEKKNGIINPEYISTMSASLVADSILLAEDNVVVGPPVPPSSSSTSPTAISVNRVSTMQLIQDADYELEKFNEDVDTIMNAVVKELNGAVPLPPAAAAQEDDDTIMDEQQQQQQQQQKGVDKYSAAIDDKYSSIVETWVEAGKSSNSINNKSSEEQLQSLFQSLNFSVRKQNKLLPKYVGREDVLIAHLTRLHDERVGKDTLKKETTER